MRAAGDLASIAELCKAIGNEVTDDSGFVPMRRLLSRFDADLYIRPLLVEGMLASISPTAGSSNGKRWAVLVDGEKYPYESRDVEEERQTRPLSPRLRYTIAHELVHSLAFRASEFRIQLKGRSDTPKSLRDLVNTLERETDQLSPLLLWSEKALRIVLRGRKETFSLYELLEIMEKAGISRYVLVNRLRLVRPATDTDGFLFSPGLRNLAIGLGVWGPRNAEVKGWPLFCNFDDGIVPSFLLKIPGHERVPAEVLFSDQRFAMLGGSNNPVELETTAGTRAVPDAAKMKVQIALEEGLRKQGEEFLFVVRRTLS
jgi:hypothetical protein